MKQPTITPVDGDRLKIRRPEPDIRDQFAMAALTGAIASLDCDPLPFYQAKQAYEIADAMLKERGK